MDSGRRSVSRRGIRRRYDHEFMGRLRSHYVHRGTFEGLQFAGIAHGMGSGSAENGGAAVGLSRLHQHRPQHVDGSVSLGRVGAGAPRVDFEPNAGNFVAQLSRPADLAKRPRGFLFARAAEGWRNRVGRAATRPELRANGGAVARKEKRSSGGRRAARYGIFRAIRVWRRLRTFAKSAGAY